MGAGRAPQLRQSWHHGVRRIDRTAAGAGAVCRRADPRSDRSLGDVRLSAGGAGAYVGGALRGLAPALPVPCAGAMAAAAEYWGPRRILGYAAVRQRQPA